jgi:hypothetical protein
MAASNQLPRSNLKAFCTDCLLLAKEPAAACSFHIGWRRTELTEVPEFVSEAAKHGTPVWGEGREHSVPDSQPSNPSNKECKVSGLKTVLNLCRSSWGCSIASKAPEVQCSRESMLMQKEGSSGWLNTFGIPVLARIELMQQRLSNSPAHKSSCIRAHFSTRILARPISIEDAGSSAIVRAADDLQASLYRPQPKPSPALSLDEIIRLLRNRSTQGKLVDSDVLRKLVSVWTRRGMGRKGLDSILDLMDVLGPQEVSERLLGEHKRQGLQGLWQFCEQEWKLDLHGADVDGGQVLLLAWLSEVRRRLISEQGPTDFRIVTGWGKHSRVLGVSELSTAIKLVLQLTNSPFKQSIGNAGRFESKLQSLRVWLRHKIPGNGTEGKEGQVVGRKATQRQRHWLRSQAPTS